MVAPLSRLDGRAVLHRTPAGSREALNTTTALSQMQRRLLLVVNGYTPVDELQQRLQFENEDVRDLASSLLDRDLLQRLDR
ncbi:MAG TPA: hypothetical protein VN680_02635 [Burkholderiaceae bacterium]|jgi:septum formation topological specificity factor MinE|nr:hypothetical protein [Burkholderiaceae bacterium]